MASVSRGEEYHRQPDGTILYGTSWRGNSAGTCILLLPNLGETLLHGRYETLCEHLSEEDRDVIALELRGHRLSQGEWSVHAFHADTAALLAYFRSRYETFVVIASGFSASVMLEYDDQAHELRPLPPLPDGMVLLDPVFDGNTLLPRQGVVQRLARVVVPKQVVAKRLARLDVRFEDPVRAWHFFERYRLEPVRIQTPTTLFIADDVLTDRLKRLFGSVTLEQLEPGTTRAELARHTARVRAAVDRVLSGERPHRFRAVR